MTTTLLALAAIAFFVTMPSATKKVCSEHLWELCRRGKKVVTDFAGNSTENRELSMLISIGEMRFQDEQRVVFSIDCDHCCEQYSENLYIGRYRIEHQCPDHWRLVLIDSRRQGQQI